MPPAAEQPLRPVPHGLLRAVQLGVVLLLLTPLIVTKTTMFPFVVGKALYWRSIVEIVFALWVALAFLAPAHRPPRSWVLALLGAGLACSALAAWFGVSFQRSFWSNYERMEGVIDVLHQFAFMLVLVSVFRDQSSWRTLLTMNVAVSCVVALLAAASYFDLDLPFYGNIAERTRGRIGASLGSPVYLGGYCVANGIMASGFLARALFATANRAGRESSWGTKLFWLAAAALNFYALSLTDSLGARVGLMAGGALLAIGVAMVSRVRPRWIVLAVVVVVGCGAVALSTSLTSDGAEQQSSQSFLDRIPGVREGSVSLRSRWLAWQAAVEGFAAKPLLGWGPENFLVVFGRYVTDGFPRLEIHDRAHSKLLEEAATKGLLGVVSYLALWAFVFHVLWRIARVDSLPRHDRVLALFVGAALTAYFVQNQTLFDTASLTLQYLLLLGYVAHLDMEMRRGSERARDGTTWLDRLLPNATLQRSGRAVIAVAALVAVASGLVANAAIWSGAQSMASVMRSKQPFPHLERAMAFRPLAYEGRVLLFRILIDNWRRLRVESPAAAKRLLVFADAEAAAGHAVEPENWMFHHYLARLYRRVANTETRYRAVAEHHTRYSYELAPYQHTFTGQIHVGDPLPPPDRL